MASVLPSSASSFTIDGQYFALLSVDGRLRIWDTISGKLLQEYTPSSHLETTCTCLCWTRKITKKEREKKDAKSKKRKLSESTGASEDEGGGVSFPGIALGTALGKVLVYDPTSGEVVFSYEGHHSQTVNSVCYSAKYDSIYSGSSDSNIVELKLAKKENSRKWKADKITVQFVCVSPGEDAILSAGKRIKLWDIESKQLLQAFHGHSTNVSLLQFSGYKNSYGKSTMDVDGRYFLSGSADDRVINVWHVNVSTPEKNAMAAYMLSDLPVSMHSVIDDDSDKPLKLCVACRDGKIHFFANSLNGKAKRPINGVKTLYLMQKEGKKSNTTPLPFLRTRLSIESGELLLHLAAGSNVRPKFETYKYAELDSLSKKVYEASPNYLLKCKPAETDQSISYAQQSAGVKVIAGTAVLPQLQRKSQPAIAVTSDEGNTVSEDTAEVSLEERLKGNKSMASDTTPIQPATSQPSASSFASMLTQGLHSSDEYLINTVLFKQHSTDVLRSTVQRIPNKLALPLINMVVEKLLQNPSRSSLLLPWLKIVLLTHVNTITTSPDSSQLMSSLYQLLNTQSNVYPLLYKLAGRVDFVQANIQQMKTATVYEEVSKPSIVYNEESDSDDTDALLGAAPKTREEEWMPSDDESSDNEEEDDEDDTEGDDSDEEDDEVEDDDEAMDDNDNDDEIDGANE